MKIAYVAYWDMETGDGVAKKIRGHVDAWRGAGHDVELFTFAPTGLRERWRRTSYLARRVHSFHPDLVYLRYELFLPPIIRTTARYPVVAEANSFPTREFALARPRAASYERINARLVRDHADGWVVVTHELGDAFASLGKPVAVIGNSIDLATFPELPAPKNDAPRLVFIGTANQPWQGIDKLVELARAEPDWHFDVIGEAALDGAPANVAVHGFLDRAEYEPLFARADVAIGQLALHRRGVEENAPLKVREYLACGLPVISGHADPDFTGDEWFLLQLPNREDNVAAGLDAIRGFVAGVRGRRVPRAEVAHLDSRVKEVQRLEFMQSVLTVR